MPAVSLLLLKPDLIARSCVEAVVLLAGVEPRPDAGTDEAAPEAVLDLIRLRISGVPDCG